MFLTYWLLALSVLVVTLKLGCNILFNLVYGLAIEVSYTVYDQVGLRFLAYTLNVFPILPTRLVCTYLVLCICFCWRLFLQAGSLGKVPARLPHNSIPSYLLLHLNPDWLACFALLLLFNLTVYLYKLSIMSLDKHLSIKENGFVFFWLSGISTPELVNLKNTAYFPFQGFWVPLDFHSQFTYCILTSDPAI